MSDAPKNEAPDNAYNALSERAPLPPGAAKFYMAGSDDRPTDTRTVGVAVRVRADLKIGDRDFSASLCMHEVAVLRRFYEMRAGGAIRLATGWQPALPRLVPLTHDKLKAEAERMARTFVVSRNGQPPVMCFADFFGQSPSEQLVRLHTVMKQQCEGWLDLMKRARGRMTTHHEDPVLVESMVQDLITEKELDELANLADPSRRGLDDIELGEIVLPGLDSVLTPANNADAVAAAKAAAEADDKPDPLEQLMDRLKAAGASERQALETASLLEIAGDPAKISDEDLTRIAGGKGRVAAFRKAIAG
jgi:hypothetical protein